MFHDPTDSLGNTMQAFVKTDSREIIPSCHIPSPDEWEDEPGEGLDDEVDGGSIDLRTLRWMQMQMQMEQHLLHGLQHSAPLGAWRMRQAERAGEAADGAEISQLETKTLSACTKCDGVCAVCQCEWEEHDEVRVLPCGHQFHTCCIDRWLSKHKACCPLCKADVRPSWVGVNAQEAFQPSARRTPQSSDWMEATTPPGTPPGEPPEHLDYSPDDLYVRGELVFVESHRPFGVEDTARGNRLLPVNPQNLNTTKLNVDLGLGISLSTHPPLSLYTPAK